MITYEANPRHAESFISELGLQNAKTLACLIVKWGADMDGEWLGDISTTKCKSSVARANYFAADRPDIQHACKGFSTAMASLTTTDYERLKRMVRYIVGRPRVAHVHRQQTSRCQTNINTDANWAGDRTTRKSTSGGVVFLGSH